MRLSYVSVVGIVAADPHAVRCVGGAQLSAGDAGVGKHGRDCIMSQAKKSTGGSDAALARLVRMAQAEALKAVEDAAEWQGSPAELAGLCEEIASRYLDIAEKASALALRRMHH